MLLKLGPEQRLVHTFGLGSCTGARLAMLFDFGWMERGAGAPPRSDSTR